MKTILALFLGALLGVSANAQSFKVYLEGEAVNQEIGESVEVSFLVKDFNDVAHFSTSFVWDETILNYESVVFSHEVDFFETDEHLLGHGKLGVTFGLREGRGLSLADGEKLLTLVFEVIGSYGESSVIYTGDDPTERLIRNIFGQTGEISLLSMGGVFVTVSNSIGKVEHDKFIRVYPNPGDGDVQLSFGGKQGLKQVYVYNALGVLCYQQQTSDENIWLNLKGFGGSTYFVRIIVDNKLYNRKIVLN